MKKQIIVLAFLVTLFFQESAAQKIYENRRGCFRSQGNIAAGYQFQQKQVSAYFTGDLDVFVHNNVSICGEIWLGYRFANDKPGLRNNHSVFFGANYHPTKKGRFDPYIGLCPGVALADVVYRDGEGLRTSKLGVAPLVSVNAGFNFYFGSVFHVFVKARFVSGQLFTSNAPNTRLDELKMTAGLGWNLRLWKLKKL